MTAYAITSESVRRDLPALERRGVVRRLHGGEVRFRPGRTSCR
ncbi:DeoR family transcriptional regulator [Streptomyces goshikiensis]